MPTTSARERCWEESIIKVDVVVASEQDADSEGSRAPSRIWPTRTRRDSGVRVRADADSGAVHDVGPAQW